MLVPIQGGAFVPGLSSLRLCWLPDVSVKCHWSPVL
uniref:Uncharacterized protein n=1 Tax=Anguilla anguilla TaxID=7936 RepID=A0A0E9TUA3_ANGAN